MTDNYKPWTRNETNQNSFGGTELHMEKLIANLDPELLQHFQLIPSRVRDLRDDRDGRLNLYVHHDFHANAHDHFFFLS